MLKRTVVIEALILWGIGIVSMVEALRLILYKDPNVLYDIFGPGSFVLLISIGLIIAGVFHFFAGYKKSDDGKTFVAVREAIIPVVCTILATAGYVFLIGIVGYAVASFLFFVAQLKIFGVNHWKINIGMAAILATVYYFVFIELCLMFFPRHYLSPLFDLFH